MPDAGGSESSDGSHGRLRPGPDVDELLTAPPQQGRGTLVPSDEFADLVRTMTPELLAYATTRVGPQVAEDVVADVFEVTLRRWDLLPPDSSDRRAWVYGTAKRTIMGSLARERRRTRLLARLRSQPEVAAAPADEGAVSRSCVEQALRGLPPDQAAVLACTVLEGLGPAQAAERLGISVAAVASRIQRARLGLRQRLATGEEDHAGP